MEFSPTESEIARDRRDLTIRGISCCINDPTVDAFQPEGDGTGVSGLASRNATDSLIQARNENHHNNAELIRVCAL